MGKPSYEHWISVFTIQYRINTNMSLNKVSPTDDWRVFSLRLPEESDEFA
jgi:hypothetical protein